MWEQRSGHFNLRDPSWRFVPRLVTLCSNTELPYQDDEGLQRSHSGSFSSRSISHPLMLLLFLSLSIPPVSLPFFFLNTDALNFMWMSATQTQKQVIQQKCLFPDLLMNNTAHTHIYTHSHTCSPWSAHFTECVKTITTNNWRSDYLYGAQNAVLMSFWKMKSVRTVTNEVTGVQHSNKTPWAVKLCFQTSAPSKWVR